MRRVAHLFFLVLLPAAAIHAQQDIWSNSQKKTKGVAANPLNRFQSWKKQLKNFGRDSSYRHAVSIGGSLNSNGWSGLIAYQQQKENKAGSTLWQLRFSEIKGEKEIKQQRDNSLLQQAGKSTPYIFGKSNNLYTLEIGLLLESLLLPAVLEGHISVGFRYGGGLSLALLKPYYLRLVYPGPPGTYIVQEEAWQGSNEAYFLNTNAILGASRWRKGLDELQYVPGLFGTAALTIEPRKGKWFFQTVTLGVQGAVYVKELPVMVHQPARNFQGSLFAGLQLGKRWR